MTIYKPYARKRFGQNFLHDETVISKIIQVINPKQNQHLVEIGPGLGALTKHLIASNAKVCAVELDRDLIPHLLLNFGLHKNFKLYEADALQFNFAQILEKYADNKIIGNSEDIINFSNQMNNSEITNKTKQNSDATFLKQAHQSELLSIESCSKLNNGKQSVISDDYKQSTNAPQAKLRIVGNLPYNISTPLIFHLLRQVQIIADMHFMLQKEVVDRLSANAGANNFGRLSVMVQYFCKACAMFEVLPSAFKPVPKVTSAIIKLVPYQDLPYQAHDFELFSQLVKQAFSQKRKTLRNCLKNMVSDAIFNKAQIDANLRAEKLSVEDFVRLANLI